MGADKDMGDPFKKTSKDKLFKTNANNNRPVVTGVLGTSDSETCASAAVVQ